MAAINFTPISLYYTTTASAVPSAGNLVSGELALNITDEKLYFKNAAGTVKLLASNAATTTGVTSFTAGTTGLTPNTATTGAVTLAGTLATTNGGTGLTSFTSGGVPYASSSSVLTTGSAFQYDGTSILNTQAAGNNQTALIIIRNSTSGTAAGSAMYWGNNASLFNAIITKFSSAHTSKPSYFEINNTENAPITFAANNTEQMRLNSTGLGIGTTSPSTPLDVTKAGGANFVATFQNTTAGTPYGVTIKDAATPSAGYPLLTVTDSTGATSYLRVDSSTGNVGIGKSPSAGSIKLDVNGVIADSNGNVRAIPQSGSAKTSSYTLATTDIGEYILLGASGAIVIPDATFATGDVVSIFNNTASTATITCTISTAYIAGTFTDKATMTLAAAGVATILFITGTTCVVSGNVT